MLLQKKVLLLFIMVGIATIVIAAPNAGISKPEVIISTGSVRLGDFFRIKVQAPSDARVKAEMFGKELWLHYQTEAFVGLVPVSYWTKPGTYNLTVEITNSTGGFLRKELPIQVIERSFPEQRIRVPETTRKKALAPENVDSDTTKTQKARSDAENNRQPPLWTGKFVWPVRGRISTDFGFVRYVNDITNGRHSGLDIVAPTGTPVVSTNQGRVILAEELHWTGLTVIVYHGLNLYSSYSHLSEMTVQTGDEVQTGSLVGKVGATGLATGPHLHFAVKVGEVSVDPYLFLDIEVGWADLTVE